MANLSDFSLEGKNAWITGASYGIGFNIAKAFVAAGANMIIFNDINEAALQRGLDNYWNCNYNRQQLMSNDFYAQLDYAHGPWVITLGMNIYF